MTVPEREESAGSYFHLGPYLIELISNHSVNLAIRVSVSNSIEFIFEYISGFKIHIALYPKIDIDRLSVTDSAPECSQD